MKTDRLMANLLCLPIVAAAWARLGGGQPLAFVGVLLYLDLQILRRRGQG